MIESEVAEPAEQPANHTSEIRRTSRAADASERERAARPQRKESTMKGNETDKRSRPDQGISSVTEVQPLLPGTAERELKELARELATAPPIVRQQLLQWVAGSYPYPVLAMVADAILAGLLGSENPDRRAALADGVAGLGPAATNRVVLALIEAPAAVAAGGVGRHSDAHRPAPGGGPG